MVVEVLGALPPPPPQAVRAHNISGAAMDDARDSDVRRLAGVECIREL